MTSPGPSGAEQCLTLDGVSWASYVSISDSLPERPGLRLIYCDGRLTFLTASRQRAWFAERLGDLVAAVANTFEIPWETAGSATFRLGDKNAGAEGDRTYYFGTHAERMLGPIDIDLNTQPPPDLAIEVEILHLADDALAVWGRLGVPEVWPFDPDEWSFGVWVRREDGTYSRAARGLFLPMLEEADVIAQMRLAAEVGSTRWFSQLADWGLDTLVPKLEKPAADG